MTTTLEIASTRAEETADLDRILGDHALFMLNEASESSASACRRYIEACARAASRT